jgi:hypothetical protein
MLSKYVFQLGLPQIEKKGNNWNFRCVICGDSKKNPNKKRGWILTDKKLYYCHNCGISYGFKFFLKTFYNHVYLEYIKDSIGVDGFDNKKYNIDNKKKIIFQIDNYESVMNLNKDHKCYRYIKNRKIPFKKIPLLYYCKNFKKEINKIYPDKFENYTESDERLLIPFFDKQKKISHIQGRTLTDDFLRYITIEFLSDKPKIYGLDRVDIGKTIYIVEGPIDSLFLDNAIAMASASININDLLTISNKSNFVFVFDLENRNKEICKKIEKMIDLGFKICLFPDKMKKYGKDINDFVKSGLTTDNIMDIIKKHTYSGLSLRVKYKMWKKI